MRFKNQQRLPAETALPPPNELSRLHALAAKIEAHRSEMDGYLDEYAKLIAPAGVPVVNIRMMLDGKGRCLCHAAMLTIAEQGAALELAEKQK